MDDLQAEIDVKEHAFWSKWANGPKIQELERQLRNEIMLRQDFEKENMRLKYFLETGAAGSKVAMGSFSRDIEDPLDTLVNEIYCFGGI